MTGHRLFTTRDLDPKGVVWRDPAALLVVYTMLLVILPGRLVFEPLGAVGRPALLVGLVGGYWWLSSRVVPSLGTWDRSPQPVHWLVLAYAGFCLLGYAVAHSRSLSTLENSSSNRAVITLASLCGIVLLTADCIATRRRLDLILGAVVGSAAFMAAVGIVQFTTGWDPVPLIRVPGLRHSLGFDGVPTRSIFNRPYGTALHPIEYGVVSAGVLPLAFHFGLHGRTNRARRWAWLATALLVLAVPMSLSRSAILTLAVALLFLASGWGWMQRLSLFAYGTATTVVMSVVIPGLLGTLRRLFTGASTDPSIVARQERLPLVLELLAERPWLGRGYGTYSPEEYFLLDNQYYKTAIEMGIVGLAGVILTLFVGGIYLARAARHRSSTESSRNLGQSIAATIAGFAVATYTFDAFYYPAFSGILFLLIGAGGALLRIERTDAGTQDQTPAQAALRQVEE